MPERVSTMTKSSDINTNNPKHLLGDNNIINEKYREQELNLKSL